MSFQIRIARFSLFLVHLTQPESRQLRQMLACCQDVLGVKRFKMNGIVLVTAWYLFSG